jgi:hypothetical protein
MVKINKCEIKSKKTDNLTIVKSKKHETKNTNVHDLKKLNNIISNYIIIEDTSKLQKLFDNTLKSELSSLIEILNYTISVFDIKNVKIIKKINVILDDFFLDQKPIQNIENPYIFESRGEIVYISKYILENSDKKCFLAIKVLSKKNKDNSHFFIVKF